jgi:hypothetical protein
MNDPVHDFPLWPMVLSVLGPGILVSAIARHDSLGVYAAGVVVTLIGWPQLVRWLQLDNTSCADPKRIRRPKTSGTGACLRSELKAEKCH